MSPRLRCAIYTRKSSEEGLEQNFNSLHAQREACEAYILSQTGEGWTAINTAYDDGGFSGGSMERPGLKQLMGDISRGLVDTVVVYKVDRLTRSLADFAKIVELFDAKGVSFVSVTQAFNTTTSMGRLTLNVLLSFAQFEREVTGERIRDKVAASKAKGLRMGGRPPLGYDIVEGRLAVNPAEADAVRTIFERYLEQGSIQALERSGVQAKRWIGKSGMEKGGGFMSHGAIHYLLVNPVYRGVTRHKALRHENTHAAIVDQDLWDRVQAKLADTNAHQPKGEKRREPARLDGLVFDDRQNPMVAVHSARGAKRYRYYVSRPKITGNGVAGSLHRISAGMLEQYLTEELGPRLSPSWRPELAEDERVVDALARLTLSGDRIEVQIAATALRPELAADAAPATAEGICSLQLAFEMRRRQGAVILQAPGYRPAAAVSIDRALVRALVLAKTWSHRLETGEVASIKHLAEAEGLCAHYTARLLPLAYLAPELAEAILAGRQPRSVSLASLTASPLPVSWVEQQTVLEGLGALAA